MQTIRICLVGFGNVGQAFARLLLKEEDEIKDLYSVGFKVTAIATGQHGSAIDPAGIDLKKALACLKDGQSIDILSKEKNPQDSCTLIKKSESEILLENTPVNYTSGQPALNHITTALNNSMHAITANKGPVLHAYQSLRELANQKGKRFLFESSVMDGAPIFSLFRSALPVLHPSGFEGILNSCTNLILERMGKGESLDQAVAYVQTIGIAETDPSGDIDGWDAAIKVAILVNVLMDWPIKLDQVSRVGIRQITPQQIQSAHKEGLTWKLICQAERKGNEVIASVEPRKVSPQSPLFSIQGTSSFVLFRSDVLPGLGILESNPGPQTTAYGLFSDLISVIRES